MKVLTRVSAALACLYIFQTTVVLANPISPAEDSTTRVRSGSTNPNLFNINGGTRSGANLFHSFDKFGLNKGQIANFQSNPSIRNILGRVIGGDASRINGLIQVVGGRSNLFLMNPSGFIFGPNATLNVPGSFTATTANGIQIGDYWFDALGKNNYANLVGEPNGFAFLKDQAGSIINSGKLSVPQGEQITLAGGLVINTGTLEAPQGKVSIISVPDQKLVKISQEGSLLSLGLPTSASSVLSPSLQGFTPLALPALLTGGEQPIATGVVADVNGVRLTGSDVLIPTDPGTALLAGQVDVSGTNGGTANVLGDKVGLLGANINASGDYRGGTVLIGGDYKGQGIVPNATHTFIDSNSVIKADALIRGPGGRVIAWADDTTAFYGEISVQGGIDKGDGGFVEVSGKKNLAFHGEVDLTGLKGKYGTLLLDPEVIVIDDAATQFNNQELNDSKILLGDNSNATFIISPDKIIGNIILEASKRITFNTDVGSPLQQSNSRIFNVSSNNLANSEFLSTKKLQSLSVFVNPPDGQTGVIEVFGNINTESLTLNNANGNIELGQANKPIEINVATFNKVELSDGSFSTDGSLGGTAKILAPKGTVNLHGGITLDAKSSLVIDSLKLSATQSITRQFQAPSGEISEQTYNFGILYFGGDTIALANSSEAAPPESAPTIQLSVQFLDNSLRSDNTKQTVLIPPRGGSSLDSNFDQNSKPNIEIIIRNDSEFSIGRPTASASGLESPITSFAIEELDGSLVINESSYNGEFPRELMFPTPAGVINPPETGPVNPSFTEPLPGGVISPPETGPVRPSEVGQFPGEVINIPEIIPITVDDSSQIVEEYISSNIDVTDEDWIYTPIVGTNLVRVTRTNSSLSYVVENKTDENGDSIPIAPEDFSKLLTGGNEDE